MIPSPPVGSSLWFDDWDGVRQGVVIHADAIGDLHVVADGKVEKLRVESTFETEADCWDHRAARCLQSAGERVASAIQATERAGLCRIRAANPALRGA